MKVEDRFFSSAHAAVAVFELFTFSFVFALSTKAQEISYQWRSVIDGGGGFVPGIIYSPTAQGLAYARTDMGGAYRWENSVGRWTPLTDTMDRNNSDFMGILSIALDPNDTNRVYMETGKYTQSWAGNGALLSSTDKGNSWKIIPLKFKVGGNEDGRGCGERLQVDPNADSILFMGTSSNPATSPAQSALWRSTDYGATWNAVTSFTPTNVNFVKIDPTSGSLSMPSKRIFVAAANTSGQSLYQTTDGGITWDTVQGQPTNVMAIRGAIADTVLYLTFANYQGPNGATSGSVWRYNISARSWTNISPSSGSYGFSGLSVYPKDPRILIVSTLDKWSPMDEVYLSPDGGSTWRGRLIGASLDHSYAPYTSTVNPHWLACIAMDPFDSSKAMFGTGFGIWACDNLFATTPTWYFKDENLEETVPMQIISPPFTNVVSAMGDYDGFRNDQLNTSPPQGRYNPPKGTTLSLAFASKVPSTIVKAYNAAPYGAYSKDGGSSWRDFPKRPRGATAGGTWSIAISADGRTIVWAPTGSALSYSTDFGNTWTACGGSVPAVPPIADMVDPGKFYAYLASYGQLWVSTDAAKTFSRTITGLPSVPGYQSQDGNLSATPGHDGDVWICCGGGGLFHSIDSGNTASKVTNVTAAFLLGFGQSAPAKTYPAIYLWGIVGGKLGMFLSIDSGASWTRINDDSHQFGYLHQISGDPRVYGRCYISAEGRGVLYGEPIGGDTISAPSTFKFNALPADSIAHFDQKVSVTWSTATDPNGKTLAYLLHFFGPGVDTIFTSSETSSTFSVGNVQASSMYTLTGYVTNGADTTATSNSISVVTASILTGVRLSPTARLESYKLSQNFPNPFNPTTMIAYQIPVASKVTLEVYNVLGQRVLEKKFGLLEPGSYRGTVSMDMFASGVYIYSVTAAGSDGSRFVSSGKMVLMK